MYAVRSILPNACSHWLGVAPEGRYIQTPQIDSAIVEDCSRLLLRRIIRLLVAESIRIRKPAGYSQRLAEATTYLNEIVRVTLLLVWAFSSHLD